MTARAVSVAGALAFACAASLVAQAPTTTTTTAATGRRYVAVGCISQEAPAGNAGASRFIITDSRGEKSTVYRLEGGDEKELTFHVGHTVELSGTLRAASPSDTGPNAKAPIMKIAGPLTYVSKTCKP